MNLLEYVFPMLTYEGLYLLGTSIARPLAKNIGRWPHDLRGLVRK